MAHFFLFSDGSYSDYAVGSLYTCDKELTEDDWYTFKKEREALRLAKLEEFKKKACERVGVAYEEAGKTLSIYRSPEHAEYNNWYRSQESDDVVFQKLHNMVKVEYVECHGGM